METPPPPSPAPENTSCLCRLWPKRLLGLCGWCARVCHGFLRLLALGFVLVMAVGFYLEIKGLPAGWSRKIQQRLEADGYHVVWSSIRLRLTHGLVLENFRYFIRPEDELPLVKTDRVVMLFQPSEWLHGRLGFHGVRIINGTVELPVQSATTATAAPSLTLTRIMARLFFSPRGARFELQSALLGKIQVTGHGLLMQSESQHAKKLPSATPILPLRVPDELVALLENLKEVKLGGYPQAEFLFRYNPDQPRESQAQWLVKGVPTTWRLAHLDGWRFQGEWVTNHVVLRSLTANNRAGRLDADGGYDLETGMLSAHVFNSLPLTFWNALLPEEWRRQMETLGVRSGKSLRLDAWLGPVPATQAWTRVRGSVAVAGQEVGGVWLEKAGLQFSCAGDRISADHVEAVIGRDRQKGPVKGWAAYDLLTSNYTGHVEGRFDPNAVVPWLGSNSASVVTSLVFSTTPSGSFDVHGCAGDPGTFAATGSMAAADFHYCDVLVSSFRTPVAISNGVMTFSDMHAVRPEGRVDGLLELDFDRSLVRLRLESTANPQEVAKVVGTKSTEFMNMFRVDGPVHATAVGVVDYDDNSQTDIRVDLSGRQCGMDWLLADEVSGTLNMKGWRVEITNIVASAYGGRFDGSVLFYPAGPEERMWYEAEGVLTNANFGSIMLAKGNTNGLAMKGRLSAIYSLAGFVGRGQGHTAKGEGRVSIRQGNLFQIPLLGGLSRLLSKIYPGLGFVFQNDFTSEFAITNGCVKTTNAELLGPVLSIRGQGLYGFDDRLDLRIQVQLLKEGLVANAVRIVTFPVTKLLEFQLEGTVAGPRWRPVNLPKEWLEMIEDIPGHIGRSLEKRNPPLTQ